MRGIWIFRCMRMGVLEMGRLKRIDCVKEWDIKVILVKDLV